MLRNAQAVGRLCNGDMDPRPCDHHHTVSNPQLPSHSHKSIPQLRIPITQLTSVGCASHYVMGWEAV